jgi:hypothetical protein
VCTPSTSRTASRSAGAVHHDELALLDIEAAVDEVGEQRGGDGGVLGRAVPEAERVLDAVGVDPQRDHQAAALELDPIEHQYRQAQILERPAHQLDQVLRVSATRTRG